MITELPILPAVGVPLNDVFNLRAAIVYEDFEAGLRAKSCLDRLAGDLNVDRNFFAIQMWSFKLLSDPAFRTAAAREAGDFELILFSAHGCGEPPVMVRDWMGEWLKHRTGQPCALAVLLDEELTAISGSTPLHKYLGGVAAEGGLDLVCSLNLQPEPVTEQTIRQIARAAINASPMLEGILDHWECYPHGGINE